MPLDDRERFTRSRASKAALRQRFRLECEILHRLNYDAIPRISANDVHEGFPFLVMEKAPGERFGTGFSRPSFDWWLMLFSKWQNR